MIISFRKIAPMFGAVAALSCGAATLAPASAAPLPSMTMLKTAADSSASVEQVRYYGRGYGYGRRYGRRGYGAGPFLGLLGLGVGAAIYSNQRPYYDGYYYGGYPYARPYYGPRYYPRYGYY